MSHASEYYDTPFDTDNYITEEDDASREIDAPLIGVDQDLPF